MDNRKKSGTARIKISNPRRTGFEAVEDTQPSIMNQQQPAGMQAAEIISGTVSITNRGSDTDPLVDYELLFKIRQMNKRHTFESNSIVTPVLEPNYRDLATTQCEMVSSSTTDVLKSKPEPECYTLSSDSEDDSEQATATGYKEKNMETSEDEQITKKWQENATIKLLTTSHEKKLKHVRWPKNDLNLVMVSTFDRQDDIKDEDPELSLNAPPFSLPKNISINDKRQMDVQWEKGLRLRMDHMQEDDNKFEQKDHWRLIQIDRQIPSNSSLNNFICGKESVSRGIELERQRVINMPKNKKMTMDLDALSFEEERWQYMVGQINSPVNIPLDCDDVEDNEVQDNEVQVLELQQNIELDWNKENINTNRNINDNDDQSHNNGEEELVQNEDDEYSEFQTDQLGLGRPTEYEQVNAQNENIATAVDLPSTQSQNQPCLDDDGYAYNSSNSFEYGYGKVLESIIEKAQKEIRNGQPCSSSFAQSEQYICSERLIAANEKFKCKEQEMADSLGIDISRQLPGISCQSQPRNLEEIYREMENLLTITIPDHVKPKIQTLLTGITKNMYQSDQQDSCNADNDTTCCEPIELDEQTSTIDLNSNQFNQPTHQFQQEEVIEKIIPYNKPIEQQEISAQQPFSGVNDDNNDFSFSDFCFNDENVEKHSGNQVAEVDQYNEDEDEENRILPFLGPKRKRPIAVIKTETFEKNDDLLDDAKPHLKKKHDEENEKESEAVYGPVPPPHLSAFFESTSSQSVPVVMENLEQGERPLSQNSANFNSTSPRIMLDELTGLVYCWFKNTYDSCFLLFEPTLKQFIGRVQTSNTKIPGLVTNVGAWYTIVYSRYVKSEIYVSIKKITQEESILSVTLFRVTAQWNPIKKYFETTPCSMEIIETPQNLLGINGFLGTFDFWCWIQSNRFVFAAVVQKEKSPQHQQYKDKKQQAIALHDKLENEKKERAKLESDRKSNNRNGYDRKGRKFRGSSSIRSNDRDRHQRRSGRLQARSKSRSRSSSRTRRNRSRSRDSSIHSDRHDQCHSSRPKARSRSRSLSRSRHYRSRSRSRHYRSRSRNRRNPYNELSPQKQEKVVLALHRYQSDRSVRASTRSPTRHIDKLQQPIHRRFRSHSRNRRRSRSPSVLILRDEFVNDESNTQHEPNKQHVSTAIAHRSRSRTRTASSPHANAERISKNSKITGTPNKWKMTLPPGYKSKITDSKLSKFVQDCPFFVRHGLCAYSMRCKFSHGDFLRTHGYFGAMQSLEDEEKVEKRRQAEEAKQQEMAFGQTHFD